MRILAILTGLSCSILLAACGGSDSSPVVVSTQNISLQFSAQANGVDVNCGAVNEISNMGSTQKTTEIQDLRFYISEVQLVNSKGQAVAVTLDKNVNQGYGVALLDFEDATGACSAGTADTYTTITGKIPTDTYTGIKFTLGVPDTGTDDTGKTIALSHSETTALNAPLDVASMAWSWQGGRKFAKIEFKPKDGVVNQKGTDDTSDDAIVASWLVHVGATGCTDATTTALYSCTSPNLANFSLNGFNASTQKVVLDVGALLVNSDINLNQNSAAGCMSGTTDSECPAIFDAFGLDLATGKASATKIQTVFKVVNK